MRFQDVAFLPSQAIFPPHFNKCGRGERITATTCPKTVVGGKQGHAPWEIPSLQQSIFLSQMNSMEIIRLSQR